MPRLRLSPEDVKHGTLTGYSWHRHWGEPACEPCLKAKRDYSRETARAAKQRALEEEPRNAAWRNAYVRLAERYPTEFQDILAEEMQGLEPPADEGSET